MSVSMYDVSVAVFRRTLTNLSAILDKAQAHADARKFDSKVLVDARLAPDMFPLSRQIQIACDFAKGCSARLAGVEVPKREDSETTLADLKARIAWTLDFVSGMKPQQYAGAEERTIVHPLRTMTVTLPGLPYVTKFSMPNFFFHVSMTYAILRHNGVDLGKMDFIGPVE